MDTRELLSKITRLPIVADGLARDMLSGSFRSVFKGQGLEFDEARHYQWGDDAKAIDWNASARLGTPFIKLYREERELTVMLLLDTSASMHCGAGNMWGNGQGVNPFEQALIAGALIAFSAERGGQRVGAFLFDREVDRVFPPRKGRGNVLAFVSGALRYHRQAAPAPPSSRVLRAAGSNLRSAITGAGRLLKRRSMVVLLSDFFSIGWEQELCDLGRKHDVIAVRISGKQAADLPDVGLISIEDPETGVPLAAPTHSDSFRRAWSGWRNDRAYVWQNLCRRAGIAHLELPVSTDPVAALTRFFDNRGR